IEKLTFQFNKTANNRLFLNSINSLTKSKDYKFEYIQPNLFPARLSFSQDHWGYFNGKSNTNILPKNLHYLDNISYGGADREPDHTKSVYGVLSKVIYPTKGYTLIEYEPNSYYDWVTIQPNPVNIHQGLVLKSEESGISKTFSIQTPTIQQIKIEGFGSFNSRDCTDSPNMGNRHKI
ncbi:sugar-binding protein, partial [Chryseobacterium pennipullorum]